MLMLALPISVPQVQYLHPKDGVYPEKVNAGRQAVNANKGRIGENPNPVQIKFGGKMVRPEWAASRFPSILRLSTHDQACRRGSAMLCHCKLSVCISQNLPFSLSGDLRPVSGATAAGEQSAGMPRWRGPASRIVPERNLREGALLSSQ